MRKNKHYVNGEWFDADDAKISIFDLSVTRGLAVFETMRSYDGKLPKLETHLTRLNDSAKEIGITKQIELTDLKAALLKGLDLNHGKDFTIKITLTAGVNEGLLSSADPTLIISFFDLTVPTEEQYKNGIKLVIFNERRFPAHIKSIDYVIAKRGLMHAHAQNADDALYVDEDGRVYETTISNIFFVKGKTLVTPAKEILFGITRQAVIDIAKELGFTVEEREVKLVELLSFDEAFVTGSVKEVLGVNSVGSVTFKAPGDVTSQLAKAYRDSVCP